MDILVSTDACTVTQDCSHMSSFECSSVSTSTIDIDADGVVTMSFDASVAEPYDECGESSCPACTAYKSCVGPMVQTDQQTLNAGDCILWEYSTTGKKMGAFGLFFFNVYISDLCEKTRNSC